MSLRVKINKTKIKKLNNYETLKCPHTHQKREKKYHKNKLEKYHESSKKITKNNSHKLYHEFSRNHENNFLPRKSHSKTWRKLYIKSFQKTLMIFLIRIFNGSF